MSLADSYSHADPDSGNPSTQTSGSVAYRRARARVLLAEDIVDVLLGDEKPPEFLSPHVLVRKLCAFGVTHASELP